MRVRGGMGVTGVEKKKQGGVWVWDKDGLSQGGWQKAQKKRDSIYILSTELSMSVGVEGENDDSQVTGKSNFVSAGTIHWDGGDDKKRFMEKA